MTSTTCPLARDAKPTHHVASGYGSVAGAVLRSARRSARTSQARLAAACGVTENTIRAWENGSSPLASVPMPQMEAVIAALHDAGACRPVTEDLIAATWCDIIVAAVAASEDVTCLLTDPIVAEDAFGELMAWCLEGRIPSRHRTYAAKGSILTDQAVIDRVREIFD